MIVPYAVVPVLVFALMLNFFYLSPIDSLQCGESFSCCQDCLKSDCHTKGCRPCAIGADNSTINCFLCLEDPVLKNKQFYSQPACEAACEDKNKCYCDGMCWVCAMNSETKVDTFKCEVPCTMYDDTCTSIISYDIPEAYVGPAVTPAPTPAPPGP